MFKRIKAYFDRRKLKKLIDHEILETLASICLCLGNAGAKSMYFHFRKLKEYNGLLRKEIEDDKRK